MRAHARGAALASVLAVLVLILPGGDGAQSPRGPVHRGGPKQEQDVPLLLRPLADAWDRARRELMPRDGQHHRDTMAGAVRLARRLFGGSAGDSQLRTAEVRAAERRAWAAEHEAADEAGAGASQSELRARSDARLALATALAMAEHGMPGADHAVETARAAAALSAEAAAGAEWSSPLAPGGTAARALQPVVAAAANSSAVGAAGPAAPAASSLNCSGVGVPAVGNASFVVCAGQQTTPAVRAAVAALQAAVTAGAGQATLQALEAALLAAPGLNASALIPRGTPIPAGANFSALPLAAQQALLASANVSSVSNITSFDQIIAPDGSIAGGRLSPVDLLPLLPVNATVALVQDIRCRDAFSLGDVCACPLDFRGDRCQSRRSLVVTLAIAHDRIRRCVETPDQAPLYPDVDPDSPPEPAVLGWAGADLLAVGLPPCVFFSSPGSGLRNAPPSLSLPLSVETAFHPDDAPQGWLCNGSLLTDGRADALLALEGRTRATAAGPPPYLGLPCAEAAFRYAVGPTLAAAATESPRLTAATRLWSFDALSDDRYASSVDVLEGAEPGDSPPRPAVSAASSLPAPAEPLVLEVLQDGTGPRGGRALGRPGRPANASFALRLRVPGHSLPERFRPSGRAHLEVAVWQAIASSADAFPPVDVVPADESPVTPESNASRPPLTPLPGGAFAARLRAWPPLPVRRPWPVLALALDDAEWSPPTPRTDPRTVVTALSVSATVLALSAVLGCWWCGRCGAVEDALAMEGWMARSQVVARARTRARGAAPDEGEATALGDDEFGVAGALGGPPGPESRVAKRGGQAAEVELHAMDPAADAPDSKVRN